MSPRSRASSARLPPRPAKLSPPRLSAVLARPRLFKLLDQASRRPVIWVVGPAGSGKTTLAASWLARRGGKSLWYQIDARDRDPATFFSYLRDAVRRLAPRREPLPLLTPEYWPGLENYARNLFDGVFERLGAPAVLVLDDFQELSEGAALHGILAAALAGIPEGVHVLVLSRTAPPPEFARLRANCLVASLGWEALRFTDREVAGLLAEHRLPRPRSGPLAALYDEAEGWAAGLVLLGEAARRDQRWVDGNGRRGRPPDLFDYFAKELFERADLAVQRVLLATASLPAMTARIAEQLAGEGAGATLERLARDNFFTTLRGSGEPVYQYHPLFRAFLLARAQEALAPDERAGLLRLGAKLLDESGQPEEAFGLLQEAGDGAGAGALVVRLAPALEAQGRLQTLEAWIRSLPDSVRDADPWLLHWLGVCQLPARPRESLAHEERAFAAFQARGDDAGSLAAWSGATRAILMGWGDLQPDDPWMRWMDERMRRSPELSPPAVAAEVIGNLVRRVHWSAPSHPDLRAWAERLARIAEELEEPGARTCALTTVLTYRGWVGDAATLASVEQLERACRAPSVPVATRIEGLGIAAMFASHATFDPERALALATEALRLAQREGIHARQLWLHGIAATAHLSRRDAVGAAPHLEALRRHAGADLVADCWGFRAASLHALLLGDPDRALAEAERALKTAENGQFTLLRTYAEYLLAQVHRVRGDSAAAARHLAVAEATAAAARAAPFVWACRLMRAQLALDGGNRDAGRKLLAEALAEGRRRGFTNVPFSSTAHALAGLCEEALEAGLEVEYVRRLIRLHDLTPDPSRAGDDRWPFALRVTALGRFALQRAHGHAVVRASGRSKPLDLLKTLVALGGREVPEDRLVSLLWPDAEGDRGRQRLKFTLHALRRLLGQEGLLTLEKGLLSLDARRVWVDAWELQRQLVRLVEALERGREGEAADALGRALELRRGPLLEGEDAPWAVAARERLEVRLRRLLVRAIELEGVERLTPLTALELAGELFPVEPALHRALALARARAAS